jgi:hypothetical protein
MLPESLQQFADPATIPATITALNNFADPAAAADAYLQLVTHFYWQHKNIKSVITLTQAGIAYTTARPELHKTAAALAYNLASFCWPGWNEPGITLTPAQIAIGNLAAQQHAQLVSTLHSDPIKKSRAAWLTAAHHLAAKNYAQALADFTRAAELAQQANNETQHLLNRGYLLIAQSLAVPSPATTADLDQLKSQLKAEKDGPNLTAQLETAETVFRP